MKLDNPLKFLVLAAAVWLGSLLRDPKPVLAQSAHSTGTLYIEPGVQSLRAPNGSRQVLGKVVVDLTNGNVWGFPTTVQQPYPVNITSSQPPTSQPFLLGKFDFARMNQP